MMQRRRAQATATALKGQTARNGRASRTCRCAAALPQDSGRHLALPMAARSNVRPA